MVGINVYNDKRVVGLDEQRVVRLNCDVQFACCTVLLCVSCLLNRKKPPHSYEHESYRYEEEDEEEWDEEDGDYSDYTDEEYEQETAQQAFNRIDQNGDG